MFGYKVLPLGRLQLTSWPSYLPKDVLRRPDTFLNAQVFSIVKKLCFIIEMKIIYLLQSLFCFSWFWAVNKEQLLPLLLPDSVLSLELFCEHH